MKGNSAMLIAIVTGASTGIGKAAAEALARAGYRVFGTSRSAKSDGPAGVEMVTCDVTAQDSVDRLVAHVLAEAGQIDLVVNNAGLGLVGGAEESSLAQVQALFDVNFYGAIRVINAVLPAMRSSGSGRILNVSSALGLAPGPYLAHYSASKFALEGYSESVDHELRGFGIRVSLIEPAYTRTSMEGNSLVGDRPLPVYADIRARMHDLNAEFLANGDDPSVVADTIVRAAQDPSPRLRYPAGKMAKQISLLRRLVPSRMFDKSLRQQLGLPA
jgi:NAD(P)-dependent dehydrogenase (short-subunit alcohol dehydrogenase family)